MTDPTPPTRVDPATVVRDVAAAIRAEIGRRGWTGRRLSEESGVNHVTLSRRLRGSDPGFRLDELVAVAQTLRMTVSDLVGDNPPATT